jgi:hypothetical protein
MKLVKVLGLSLAALFLTQSALAASKSAVSPSTGHFTLNATSKSAVWPGEDLVIPFGILNPYVWPGYYSVHCYVNADSVVPVTAYMDSLNWASVYLNGHKMDMYGDHLLPGSNTLDIIDVNANNGNLFLHNDDYFLIGGTFYLSGACSSEFYY